MSDVQFQPYRYRGTVTIPTSDSVTAGTQTLGAGAEGLLKQAILVTADMEDTDSTNFEINNPEGDTYFESGTQAESSTVLIGSEVTIQPDDQVVMTAEGTQSANRSVVYELRGLR